MKVSIVGLLFLSRQVEAAWSTNEETNDRRNLRRAPADEDFEWFERMTQEMSVPTNPSPVAGPTGLAPPVLAPTAPPTTFPTDSPSSSPTERALFGAFGSCQGEFGVESFQSIAATGEELIKDGSFGKEVGIVEFGFDYSWLGLFDEDTIYVTGNGAIYFSDKESTTGTKIQECNNPDPISSDVPTQKGECGDLTRIAVCHSSLATNDGNGGVYHEFDSTADGGKGAVIISWENVGFTPDKDTDPLGSLNFQATLFSEGAVKICFGSAGETTSTTYASGIEDGTFGLLAPATSTLDGLTSTFTQNTCTCFRPPTPPQEFYSCTPADPKDSFEPAKGESFEDFDKLPKMDGILSAELTGDGTVLDMTLEGFDFGGMTGESGNRVLIDADVGMVNVGGYWFLVVTPEDILLESLGDFEKALEIEYLNAEKTLIASWEKAVYNGEEVEASIVLEASGSVQLCYGKPDNQDALGLGFQAGVLEGLVVKDIGPGPFTDYPSNSCYCLAPGVLSAAGSPDDFPSESPSETPSETPSDSPTESPEESPEESPTESPTESPSAAPVASPTGPAPTDIPSEVPSETPSEVPSNFPTVSPVAPTKFPTESPSDVTGFSDCTPDDPKKSFEPAKGETLNKVDKLSKMDGILSAELTGDGSLVDMTLEGFDFGGTTGETGNRVLIDADIGVVNVGGYGIMVVTPENFSDAMDDYVKTVAIEYRDPEKTLVVSWEGAKYKGARIEASVTLQGSGSVQLCYGEPDDQDAVGLSLQAGVLEGLVVKDIGPGPFADYPSNSCYCLAPELLSMTARSSSTENVKIQWNSITTKWKRNKGNIGVEPEKKKKKKKKDP